MSIANLFIKRPVLTTVCTIIILLVGGVAIPLLPIAKLPQIAPTQIEVTGVYTGANAKTTVDNITTILERKINGVEEMKYITSNTSNNGVANIQVVFPPSLDSNTAQVNVQNRVAQADAELPEAVKQTGVITQKSSPNILLAYAFYSDKGENGKYFYNNLFLSNYLDLFVIDEIKRVEGVGKAELLGERKYAMRIWLDPDALAARNLSANDVVKAIQEQNIQVGAGKIGQEPVSKAQSYEIGLNAVGRFTTAKEAEELIVHVGKDGTLIKIKDLGRAELGAENYETSAIFNGSPAVGLAIFQLPGSNALDVAKAVEKKIAELKNNFPSGLKAEIAFDTTSFVTASLKEVCITLLEAIVLVILVIFVFLQDWRTTLIPAIAIPVSLIGTMAFLLAFGFEVNQLTLFACVLVTGLVVDDGIVVVEAIANKINQGMRPIQAALDAMQELTGAVIATSLVLLAVFIPIAFFPGTTGIIYQQFALTITFSVAISTFNALSFSPSVSAIILRPQKKKRGLGIRVFHKFNRFFDWLKVKYREKLEALAQIKPIVIGMFTTALIATVLIYRTVPSGFVPEEDQGYFFIFAQSPAGVSLNHTEEVLQQVTQEIKTIPEIENAFGTSGFSFDGNGSNKGTMFIKLKPWSERFGASKSVFGILQKLNQKFAQKITEAQVLAINAPPVDGLSNFGGFEFQLQNRGSMPMEVLIDNANKLIAAANQRPELQRVFTQFTSNTPQMSISVDRNRAKALNLDIDEIFNTLQTYLGSNFINHFVYNSRLYRVYAQAEAEYRSNPEDIGRLYVRSQNGKMVQLNDVVKVEEYTYPPTITHYNIYPSIKIQGIPAPGYSSGQVIEAMEEVAEEVLSTGFGYEWTGTALEQKSASSKALVIFSLGFVMVFLVLAAQYESYIDPIIIILAVPLAILGALSAVWLRANVFHAGDLWPSLGNNIYCQIGLVMLIGLASKNAILIVEFANQLRAKRMSIVQSAFYAAQQRLRPILMTAISGLVGYLPLITATGAGAMSRWSLGTTICGGYLISTILSLFLVPILYIVIKNLEATFLRAPRKIN